MPRTKCGLDWLIAMGVMQDVPDGNSGWWLTGRENQGHYRDEDGGPPPYSTELRWSGDVLDLLRELDVAVQVLSITTGWSCILFRGERHVRADETLLATAIGRAALRWFTYR